MPYSAKAKVAPQGIAASGDTAITLLWQPLTGAELCWYTPVRKVFAEREVPLRCLGGNKSTGTR